jgi:fluoride exporter
MKYVMIAVGGSAGAIARYVLGNYIGNRAGSLFPYGTMLINLSGSFVIGLVMTVIAEHADINRNVLYLVVIGFIGAYTTFSTFEFETLRLLQDGQLVAALTNVAASVVIGFAMVWLGVIAGRMLI